MPKRKWEDLQEEMVHADVLLMSSSQALRLQRQRLDSSMTNGKKQLLKALKIARGFERQKLGRRQKQARQEHAERDLLRLEAESAKLKDLDLLVIAELYLFKTLGRIKSIAAVPAFPLGPIAKPVTSTQPTDATYMRVTSRLFKSNAVREAIELVIEAVRESLALPPEIGKEQINFAKDVHQIHGAREDSEILHSNRKPDLGDPRLLPLPHSDTECFTSQVVGGFDDEATSHERLENRPARDSNGAGSEVNYSDYQHTYDQFEQGLERLQTQDSDGNKAKRGLLDNEHEDDERTEPDAAKSIDPSAIIRKGKKLSEMNTKANKTLFLPSLSMGGYWSGSDASINSSNETPASIGTRKNRRGQQARRALWEKKYGIKANHVKKQTQSRNHGWDAREGAHATERTSKRGPHGAPRSNKGRTKMDMPASGANSDPVVSKKEKEQLKTATLHPSWVAAKRLKEQKRNIAYEGKKVTFT